MKVVRAIGQAFEVCHKLNLSHTPRSANPESADLILGNDNTNGSNSGSSETNAEAAAVAAAAASCTGNNKKSSSSSSSPAIAKGTCSCEDERPAERVEDAVTGMERGKKEEELMMKASSTPAIISSCSRKNLSIQSIPRGDACKLSDASKEAAAAASGALLSSSSHDLSSVSNSLKMIEERIEQLAGRIARMEVNQSKLLQILLPDKSVKMDPAFTLSGMSDYRNTTSSADPPVMIQKSVMGLPSSASLPLDCLSFNSIHMFQQSNQLQQQQHQANMSASTASTPNPTSTCNTFHSADHTYQPHYHSILTGYQMSSSSSAGSKPPDSLPLQSPGHDSLLSSGQSAYVLCAFLLLQPIVLRSTVNSNNINQRNTRRHTLTSVAECAMSTNQPPIQTHRSHHPADDEFF